MRHAVPTPRRNAASRVAGAFALAALVVSTTTALPAPAGAAKDLKATDPDAITKTPAVVACSVRYPLVADLTPAMAARNGKKAIREGFDSRKQWGTKKNVRVLRPRDSGIGEPALRVTYPKGTSSPSDNGKGGAGFYSAMEIPPGTDRACLRYKVRFPEGFEFVKGGKLPGLYGGKAPSGGDDVSGENGFSMRLMWREDGQGEVYEYVANKGEDTDYGLSVGRGLWTFPTGRWVTVEQEVILNDPDRADGIVRIWIDGKPILEQDDIAYRTEEGDAISGLMFSTFFGGSGKEWRTPREQHVDFGDFRLYAPTDADAADSRG
ncbi:polysaccharide lyase [Caenispirillum salinarum]|nr:hypothetical protein [Caenispirillum salinarum]